MSLDLVKHRLYTYQQEGMLHLAFTGRALLTEGDPIDRLRDDILPRWTHQEDAPTDKNQEPQKRLTEARKALARSEHKQRMARVLIDGDFVTEAITPMKDAVGTALLALAVWQGHDAETPLETKAIESLLIETGLLAPQTTSLVTSLHEQQAGEAELPNPALLAESDRLLKQAAALLKPSGYS